MTIEDTFTLYLTALADGVFVGYAEAPPPAYADTWVLALDCIGGGCTWRHDPSVLGAPDVAGLLEKVELWDPDVYPIVVAAATAERDLLVLAGFPRP